MAIFLARTDLSRGDLRLFITNQDGHPQDAYDVRWTVYLSGGIQISGKSLKAIKAKTGEYYAPWRTSSKNGNYQIVWEWKESPGYPVITKTENLFVINPSDYTSSGPVNDEIPNPGEFTYLKGTLLGREDLPLYLTDDDGFPISVFGVFWTIYNAVGSPITERTGAVQAAIGEYYAPWYITVGSGEYLITWEYLRTVDSPLESKSMRFSIIDPAAPYAPLAPISCCCASTYDPTCSPIILAPQVLSSCCPSPCASTSGASAPCTPTVPIISTLTVCGTSCCSIEIPRTIHISAGTQLPTGGACTDQPVYSIPEGVRNVSFYITYTRGATGGYPKFRLLWGNGVEETQETMIDMNFEVLSPSTVAQDIYLQNLTGPVPDTDSAVNSILHVCIPGGATTVRLLACEEGAPATPGTVGITLTASS